MWGHFFNFTPVKNIDDATCVRYLSFRVDAVLSVTRGVQRPKDVDVRLAASFQLCTLVDVTAKVCPIRLAGLDQRLYRPSTAYIISGLDRLNAVECMVGQRTPRSTATSPGE